VSTYPRSAVRQYHIAMPFIYFVILFIINAH
jgi:hypothetical protein